MGTFLATPRTWFDLARHAAAAAAAGERVELALHDGAGRCPLNDVALDELEAVHHAFDTWWDTLEGAGRPASLQPGDYNQFLAASRRLLREKAEAILCCSGGADSPSSVPVALPDLDHASVADPRRAITLFKSFLYVPHSRSLIEWARAVSRDDSAVAPGSGRAWLRIVLQKLAAEDDLSEAIDCLRTVYRDDRVRAELLGEEARLLEACHLGVFGQWAQTLGLDRTARSRPSTRMPYARGVDQSNGADVTVIVPSYRHEAFVETAIASVLAQTCAAFRLIVVDDCSPDRTVERASHIRDPRLRIVVNDRRLGLGDSVLGIIDRIDTPFVALLNSDDVFHPARLERCTAALRESNRIEVVATGVVPIDADGCDVTPENVRRLFDGSKIADWIGWFYGAGQPREPVDLVAELLEHNFLVTSSNIVCRTDFLRQRRDALRGLEYCFDWQIFLDAAVDQRLARLPEKLLDYRLHPSNTVWFDDVRRLDYTVEVNRVLAATLRRLFGPGAPQRDSADAAACLARLQARALNHSHADSLLLSAIALCSREPAASAAEQDVIRRFWQSMPRASRTGADDRSAVLLNASRVLAAAWKQEAAALRDSERASAEWLVGDALWNGARLSRVGRPVARAIRWLRERLP
jgi:glycosyltransferase involved in cell wall biosynthesis